MKNYAKPNMEIIYVGTEDDVIRTSTVDNVKNSAKRGGKNNEKN